MNIEDQKSKKHHRKRVQRLGPRRCCRKIFDVFLSPSKKIFNSPKLARLATALMADDSKFENYACAFDAQESICATVTQRGVLKIRFVASRKSAISNILRLEDILNARLEFL